MENNYKEIHRTKSTESLLNIYTNRYWEYSPEALKAIESILEERNITFDKVEFTDEELPKPKAKVTYTAMTVGILSMLITFSASYLPAYYNDFAFLVFATIAIRFFFIMYAAKLCKEHTLNKVIWLTVVLLFGGLGMVALNIAIIANNKEDEKAFTDAQNQSFKDAMPVIAHEYTHCPACLKDLMGSNKCTDCDLEFE